VEGEMAMVEVLALCRPVYPGNQDAESLGQKWCFLTEKFLKICNKSSVIKHHK
jgi:hypothetical protein